MANTHEQLLQNRLSKAARAWWARRARTVDHKAIMETFDTGGSLGSGYLFMCAMSAGIAISGLLLNSPAVIIGAMLISPLMNPIVRLGLGLTTLDHDRAGSAAFALVVGMLVALLMSMVIVYLSPIKEASAEILARTRPNLFDLLVATLSGLAGGYAMVRGRGGAVVGVAIATALMPPMTVVGYGLASGHSKMAMGAMLLFTTNLIAIAFSITVVTTWYGFARRAWRHAIAWQTILGLLLIAPLMVPLVQSLHDITNEIRDNQTVRSIVNDEIERQNARIIALQVTPSSGHQTHVELTLACEELDPQLEQKLNEKLSAAIRGKVTLTLTPVIMADPKVVELPTSSLANPVVATSPAPPPPHPLENLVDAFPLPVLAKNLDLGNRRLSVILKDQPEVSISAVRSMEQTISERYPNWTIELIPAHQPWLAVYFENNLTALSAQQEQIMGDIVWAFKRWNVEEVRVEGHASRDGNGPSTLAGRRAAVIAEYLTNAGIKVTDASGVYPYREQKQLEKRFGASVSRSTLIFPVREFSEADLPESARIAEKLNETELAHK